MKRIFTYAIALMIAAVALAHALPKGIGSGQLPQPSRIGLLAEQAKKAQQKQAMLTPIPEVRSKDGKLRLPAKQPIQRTTVTQDGNLRITTDEYGIIINVTGGENHYYTRQSSGTAYYYNNLDMVSEPQSGTVVTVWDGDVVYMYNIINHYDLASSWIKGKKEGNTITFDTRQKVYYSDYWYSTTSVCWAKMTSTALTPLEDIKTITFTIDGDKLTLDTPDNKDNYVIGIFWDDDRKATGYNDQKTVLIEDKAYTGPTYQYVDVPESATVEEWYFNSMSHDELMTPFPVMNAKVKIAFVGNDVYLQKYSLSEADKWIKGTLSGNTITFPKNQYLGKYYTYPYWFTGCNTGDVATELIDATATYDKAAGTIVFNTGYLINDDITIIHPWEHYTNAEISKAEKVYPEPIITELTATLPYTNSFETEREQTEAAVYDANRDNATFTFYNDGVATDARYTYHGYNCADDYLVFPGVELKADKTYSINVELKSNNNNPEIFEILAGEVAQASKLNIEVVPKTTINHESFETYGNSEFSVAKDGTYFIALHCLSDKLGYMLDADNFTISENDPLSPDVVTNLKVKANETGEKRAVVSCVLPTKALNGTTISSSLNVRFTCDGKEAYTTTAAPGATVSGEITVDASAMHKVAVTTNYDGHYSASVYVREYIGEDFPSKVINTGGYDRNDKVELFWEAPKKGIYKRPINPKTLTYNIYPVSLYEWGGQKLPVIDKENPYVAHLAATTYTIDPYETNVGEQDMKYFAISAANELGEGETEYAYVLTGEAYEMPFHETFPNNYNTYWWERDCDDDTYNETGGGWIASYGDVYAFTYFGIEDGWISGQTGKISLAGAKNPTVTFDYAADVNAKVSVIVTNPEGKTLTKTFTAEKTAEMIRVKMPLTEFVGQPWVRIKVLAEFDEKGFFAYTNVNLIDLYNTDLMALVSAPESVKAGDEINVDLGVTNLAEAANGNYTMKFYVNNELYREYEPKELKFFDVDAYSLTLPTSVFAVGKSELKVVVDCAADENPANNEDKVIVEVRGDDVDPVEDIKAAEVTGGVLVEWEMTENLPVTYHEDFESLKMYDRKVPEWTLVDADNAVIGSLGYLSLPFTKASWFALDQNDDELISYSANNAYSGHMYMSTLYNSKGERNNDWMISPELPGMEQTISFFAHTYNASYYGLESLEVLYSTTDAELSSFISLGTKEIPGDLTETIPPVSKWYEYSYDLPEGTKYFALRCVSENVFALFVDYVTFIKYRTNPTAYNVYVDGTLSGTAGADDRSFLCRNHLTEGYHTFSVSALYGEAESLPLSIDIKTAGIADITTDDDAPAAIYNLQGIRVNGADLPSGFYIVNGRKVFIK
ncbi:MAG: hypothetical protein HUK14_04100 [Muribaculaceae bacterium]|nr:hypothetical protein [Muribaculaceae bacterium]